MNRPVRRIAAALSLTLALAACGSTQTPATTSPSAAPAAAGTGSDRVLPTPTNPITNTATAEGLTITAALVENNVDPATGKAVDDHLEIQLKNTTTTPLDKIEIYYTLSDPTTGANEGYYAALDGLTIAPGEARSLHFDGASAPDHYPVNRYSLYYTDKNALTVDITASAPTVKPATFTVHKDAGGAEASVE